MLIFNESPVLAEPYIVEAIYVALHGPLSLHVLCGKYQMLSPKYWLFFPITIFNKFVAAEINGKIYTICCTLAPVYGK